MCRSIKNAFVGKRKTSRKVSTSVCIHSATLTQGYKAGFWRNLPTVGTEYYDEYWVCQNRNNHVGKELETKPTVDKIEQGNSSSTWLERTTISWCSVNTDRLEVGMKKQRRRLENLNTCTRWEVERVEGNKTEQNLTLAVTLWHDQVSV